MSGFCQDRAEDEALTVDHNLAQGSKNSECCRDAYYLQVQARESEDMRRGFEAMLRRIEAELRARCLGELPE